MANINAQQPRMATKGKGREVLSPDVIWCLFGDILAYSSTLYLNRHVCDDLILNVHHVNVCMLRATTNVLSAADMYHNYGQ